MKYTPSYLRQVLFTCFSGRVVESRFESEELLGLVLNQQGERELLEEALEAVLHDPSMTLRQKAAFYFEEDHAFPAQLFQHVWETISAKPFPLQGYVARGEPDTFKRLRGALIDVIRRERAATQFLNTALLEKARLKFLEAYMPEMDQYRREGKVFFVREFELPFTVGEGITIFREEGELTPARVSNLVSVTFVYSLIDTEWYEVIAYPSIEDSYSRSDPRISTLTPEAEEEIILNGAEDEEDDDLIIGDEAEIQEIAEELLAELKGEEEDGTYSPMLYEECHSVLEALYVHGKYDLVIEIGKTALLLWPEDGSLHFALARCYFALGGDDYMSAKEAIQKAIKLSPENALYHRTLGEILLMNNDCEGSLVPLREAIRLDPSNPEFVARLSVALVQCGDLTEASRLIEGALVDGSQSEAVLDHAGMYRLLTGDVATAEELFRGAVQIAPENEYLLGHLEWAIREQSEKRRREKMGEPYVPLYMRREKGKRFF